MPVERTRLEANGLSFSVLAEGPRDGRVALLLHGFPEGKESWLPIMAPLARAGWRAIAPDLRGYGGTDAPAAQDAYSMEHLVADVRGLVDALGEDRVDLVGHDWGALVGWPFVSRHPDRVRTWTSLSIPHPAALARASGLDGNSDPDPEQHAGSSYIRLLIQPGKAERVLLEDDGRRLRAMLDLGGDVFPNEVADGFVKGFRRPGRLTAALNYYRMNLRPAAFAAYPPVPRPVEAPSLLIWGDQDPALRRRAVEETAALMAGPFRLAVLEGAGHWLQYDRPDDVSRLLLEHLRQAEGR